MSFGFKKNNSYKGRGQAVIKTKVGGGSLPEIAVLDFYDWYLKSKQNVLADKSYLDSIYLSNDYKNYLEMNFSDFKEGEFDPIICSRVKPSTIDIHKASPSGKLYYVRLTEIYPDKQTEQIIELKADKGFYYITGIKCGS